MKRFIDSHFSNYELFKNNELILKYSQRFRWNFFGYQKRK
ncbi:MAG: hypothetical protein ACI9Z4_001892 [Polaribacter sp.]|jgi:hypothetical protein